MPRASHLSFRKVRDDLESSENDQGGGGVDDALHGRVAGGGGEGGDNDIDINDDIDNDIDIDIDISKTR